MAATISVHCWAPLHWLRGKWAFIQTDWLQRGKVSIWVFCETLRNSNDSELPLLMGANGINRQGKCESVTAMTSVHWWANNGDGPPLMGWGQMARGRDPALRRRVSSLAQYWFQLLLLSCTILIPTFTFVLHNIDHSFQVVLFFAPDGSYYYTSHNVYATCDSFTVILLKLKWQSKIANNYNWTVKSTTLLII